MAGQGPFLPQVAIAGAPAAFPGAPAAVATPAAVTPQDVVAAADYRNAVKQLKSVWQTLAEFYRSILSSYVVSMHFADCCNLFAEATAAGEALVTAHEEADVSSNYQKAVAAHGMLVYSRLSSVTSPSACSLNGVRLQG